MPIPAHSQFPKIKPIFFFYPHIATIDSYHGQTRVWIMKYLLENPK